MLHITTRRSVTLAAAAAIAGLAGCTTPSEGDRLITQGNAFSGAGQNLNEGEKLVRQGRKELSKARKKRRKAEGAIESAESKIQRGERLISEARSKLATTR